MRRLLISSFIAVVLSLSVSAQSKSISGVWQLVEMTTTGPEAKTVASTQPSMYLFTKKHYSVIYVAGSAPRPVLADIKKATADELRSIFVDNFVANAGTYEMAGNKLTVKPVVAKSPGFMAAGSYGVYNVKMEGSMMTLTTESSNTGPAANPTTFKLKRVE